MGPENEDCVGDTSSEKLQDESSSEDQEEALSLSDLPINHNNNALHDHSSVPPAADFFEFFTTSYSDMCPADDIILYGKLLPLKQTYQITSPPFDYLAKQNTRCKRSESLSELNSTTHSNSIKARAVKSSRSLDDRKRHRRSHSSFVSDQLDRNCSKVPKSRWQLLISLIGMVRFPPEMVLRDIKNRQSRRSNPSTLLPGSEAKSPAAIGSNNNGSSWGLIKALSCKDHTSISVTTSFVCMPHI